MRWTTVFLIILLSHPISSQTPAARFGVASVKPSTGTGSTFTSWSPQGINAKNIPLRNLIEMAYEVRDFQIVAAPQWISSERYDIAAKPNATDTQGGQRPIERPLVQMHLMLQTLLADRFKLRVHREMKELPVYALTVAKDGVRMRRSQDATCPTFRWSRNDPGIDAPPPYHCEAILTGPNRQLNHTLDAVGMSIAPVEGSRAVSSGEPSGDLIDFLLQWGRLDHSVIDKTGLTGRFDLHLEWSWQTARDASALDQFSNPSIFNAFEEELGLKMELTKGPAPVVVIDHVERPDEK
ncbi:MAG TPA: TIGR03435 family protein [Bryobacteraceae bacterium]|nr:TIGR03435 family protein [Bryobacteraceae bacterium]